MALIGYDKLGRSEFWHNFSAKIEFKIYLLTVLNLKQMILMREMKK